MNTTETVYLSRDNTNVVAFYEDNVAMDFTGVTRVVLQLYNRNNVLQATADSNSSPTPISWATNEITFSINDVSISPGLYPAKVVIYDSTHPDGQVIAHPSSEDDLLVFRVVNA